MHKGRRFVQEEISEKPLGHVIHMPSADVSKLGSVIVLDLTSDEEAMEVALKLAQETGRRVTVRDANLALVRTIPAANVH